MTSVDIRRLLNDVDLADPHEFATAYVAHVEATGHRPPLAAAVLNWARFRRLVI